MICCYIGKHKLSVPNTLNNLLLGMLTLQALAKQTLHARYLLYKGYPLKAGQFTSFTLEADNARRAMSVAMG